jgi:CubicO group peptidase (beta-lactamase class C family)
MRRICGTVVVWFVFSCGLSASGQNVSPASVDNYVTAEMAKQHIPGLALGVYRDGEIVKAQGYGLADVELNVPVKAETIFQSGSVGKQFTATGIMMLVEEGKIGLDDSVRKYFPEAPASWQDIKIRNLLSHTSGLAEYESAAKVKPRGPIDMRADYTEDEMVKIIESFSMDFRPGEKWAYRNTNYVLLGVIIHKVTGKFYGDFLQERIFKPIGMNNTRIISEADIIPNRSSGYQIVKGQLKNQDWVSPFFNSTADGALYFNVLDLARWDQALYTEKLLKKSSLDQMWTVFKLNDGKPNSANYGFAWAIKQVNDHKVIEHGGAWQGFTTFIARYVDDKLTVVVLTNLDAGHSNPGKIAHYVAGLYNPALMPPERKPIQDNEPQVTALFRAVLAKIAGGKADPNDFTPAYRAELFPDEIKNLEEALKTLGPPKSFDLLERKEKEEDHQRVYTYRAAFADVTYDLQFSLEAGNRIAAMEITAD